MENNYSLLQAKHNYCVCNYVSKKADYCDWTITIAFYSAVHYLRHLMLPHQNFATFESLFRATKDDGEGRHGFQSRFVSNYFPEVRIEYAKLYSMSNNARYCYYKYDREHAKLAKECLETIKVFVEKSTD